MMENRHAWFRHVLEFKWDLNLFFNPKLKPKMFLSNCAPARGRVEPVVLLHDAVEDEGVAPARNPVRHRQPGERDLGGGRNCSNVG